MSGAELIAAERERQVKVEKWSAEHDDEQSRGQLLRAAECYSKAARTGTLDYNMWPWELLWWKPADSVRMLVKAGALIAAEIDRLQRLEEPD